MSKNVPTFTVGELFATKSRYVIPVYQRNYAWTDKEIAQLLQDVWDYASPENRKNKHNYYIGTLIVFDRQDENETVYETIDGQQRLTTLVLILHALHREFDITDKIPIQLSLEFDSRKTSSETLNAISSETEKVHYYPTREYNVNIQQGYKDVVNKMKKLLTTAEMVSSFYEYLVNSVRIVRVSVPEKTDLNHYFEIMNNRGEQLEKQEILKARMLNELSFDDNLSNAFNVVWEACSDMERYVQYGFTVEDRHRIFGRNKWSILEVDSLEEIGKIIAETKRSKKNNVVEDEHEYSLLQIAHFKKEFEINPNEVEDAPDRFTSVINFPNFLLHVLRVYSKQDISLDDKRLLDIFLAFFKEESNVDKSKEEKVRFVKEFGFALLKCKLLFDHNIIKREFIREKEQWSLKSLKWYEGNKVSYVNSFGDNGNDNKELVMILSMFHVSAPTMVYKNWLSGALHFLYEFNGEIDRQQYKTYLESLARAYFFRRFVAKVEPMDYYKMMYQTDVTGLTHSRTFSEYNFDNLDKGTQVENFVFNYLDYILWQKSEGKKDNYEFTSGSSVEHFYPQNPISEEHRISQKVCDQFGNLCLISRSKNSKLSNLLPSGKKDFYRDSNAEIDSLKQKVMMNEFNTWSETEIRIHGELMKAELLNY